MKARAASMPALLAACGALIAVVAFYGRSWLEFTLLALALAASVLTAYYGVRRSLYYFLFGLLGGALSCFVNRVPEIPASLFDSGKTVCSFEILNVGEGPKSLRCVGKALPPYSPFRAYINVTDKSENIRPGDIIETNARIDDVFHTSELPFMESAVMSARADGVSARIVTSFDNIRITGHADRMRYRLLNLRDRLAMYAYRSDLPPDVSALIASVCLGTSDTPVSVKERFRASGTAHLLCVSGFHVGIVALLATMLLWPLRLWSRAGRIRYLLTAIIVWLYVGLIGFTPSAIRAAIMISVYYTGHLLQRGSSGYNSIALAFAILLLVQPRWLFSIGMQLSVCAVLGILVFAARLNPAAQRDRPFYHLCEVFTVPVAAVIGTAPILLCRFHTLPLLTVVTNAFTTLLFAPFMIIGGISIVLNSFGIPVGALSSALSFIYNMIVRMSEFSSPENTLSGIYLTDFRLILLIVGIVTAAILVHATKLKTRLAAGASVLVIAGLSACDNTAGSGSEIIVAGTSSSSEIIIRHGGTGYALPISNSPANFSYMNDYFGGYGITAESIIRNPDVNTIDIPAPAIATMPRKYRRLVPAEFLVVDGSFSDDTGDCIELVGPATVVLCRNVPPRKREEWEEVCRRKGIRVMQLGSKAIRLEL